MSGYSHHLILDDAIIFSIRDRLLPIARQQFVDLVSGMRADPPKHVIEVRERIMAVQFAAGDKAVNDRGSFGTGFAALQLYDTKTT